MMGSNNKMLRCIAHDQLERCFGLLHSAWKGGEQVVPFSITLHQWPIRQSLSLSYRQMVSPSPPTD
jgi:hypothetical protein